MSLKSSPCTTVCRICLAVDMRTFPLSGTLLQAVFEKINNTTLHTSDQRPVSACFICYHQLKKCYQLIQMSVKAENVLTEIFTRCNKITKQSISLAQRKTKRLGTSLCITVIDNYDSTLPKSVANDPMLEVKMENEDEDQNTINTELYGLQDLKLELSGVSDIEDDKCDMDPEDSEQSFSVMQHHSPDVKGETTKDETSTQETEIDTHIETGQLLVERKSKSIKRSRPHGCKICKQRFLRRTHLDRHLLIHTDEKSHQCKHCSSRFFRTKYHLARHLLCMHQIKVPYDCNKCGSEFDDKKEWKKHRKTHVYECDYCHKQKRNRQDFIVHVQACNTSQNGKFECKICFKSYNYRSSLSSHLKSHYNYKSSRSCHLKKHVKPLILHECSVCHAKMYWNELRLHAKIHKPVIECNVCQRRFRKKSELVEHLRIHTGERPFECDLCHKRFRVKPTLKAHLRTHSDEKPYVCHICTRAFASTGMLRSHMRMHSDNKPFECDVCQRKFRYKQVLAGHIKTHR